MPLAHTLRRVFLHFTAICTSLILAFPASAYDSSLSEQDIREAYFLGSREGSLTPQFLEKYSHDVHELHQGNCTTEIRIETPFLQVANYSSKVPNYSSQDAVKEFHDRPLTFRMLLNICYMQEAPEPNSVKLRFSQKGKELLPLTDTRAPYAEPAGESGYLAPNGETARVEFVAQSIGSTTLTVRIDTPDGEHAKVDLDLGNIR